MVGISNMGMTRAGNLHLMQETQKVERYFTFINRMLKMYRQIL